MGSSRLPPRAAAGHYAKQPQHGSDDQDQHEYLDEFPDHAEAAQQDQEKYDQDD